jgi:hypothetical protein
VIKFVIALQQVGGFSGNSVSSTNKTESGVKHHNPKPILASFIGRGNGVPGETTDLLQGNDKLYHIMLYKCI